MQECLETSHQDLPNTLSLKLPIICQTKWKKNDENTSLQHTNKIDGTYKCVPESVQGKFKTIDDMQERDGFHILASNN